ncbi:hypothetical protein V8G54_022014 [Vigna mungo]|uniref:Uncharacterized protein n=1 Tax=Vigna mungo TaxID=3915 RepID=A0AAQ3NH75_VIGMU
MVSLVNHKSLSSTCVVFFRRVLPSHFSKFCLGLGECLYELRCGRQTSECCSVVPIRKSGTYFRVCLLDCSNDIKILWFSPFCGVISWSVESLALFLFLFLVFFILFLLDI